MGTWTIGKKMYAVVGALALLLAIGSGYAALTTGKMNDAVGTALTKTIKKLDLALRIRQNAVTARGEQRPPGLGLPAEAVEIFEPVDRLGKAQARHRPDRKSTRLNSSH